MTRKPADKTKCERFAELYRQKNNAELSDEMRWGYFEQLLVLVAAITSDIPVSKDWAPNSAKQQDSQFGGGQYNYVMQTIQDKKYFVYCRKSSEDLQRQIASIGDQMAVIAKLVEQEHLVISPPELRFTEEKSAKDPGRKVFSEMLDRIEKAKPTH